MSELSTPIGDIPGVGAPAARALAEHGLTTVGELAGRDWDELAQLHGVGPASGRRLQDVLTAHGASLLNPPAPRTARNTGSTQHTGRNAKDIKTHATDVAPQDFIAGLDERRSREGEALLEIFGEATGAPATMWGPSMIGYGEYHYVYATGREGDTFQLGFSPRTANIALYGLQGAPRSAELLEQLGKHKTGVACVWVTRLENIDLDVLRELVEHAWRSEPQDC
jgi:hypothetical protein